MAFALLSPTGAILEEAVTVSGRYVPLVPVSGSRLSYRVAPTVVTWTPVRVAFTIQRWDAGGVSKVPFPDLLQPDQTATIADGTGHALRLLGVIDQC